LASLDGVEIEATVVAYDSHCSDFLFMEWEKFGLSSAHKRMFIP